MKQLIPITILLFGMILSLGFSQGITGTKHDFTNSGWNSTGEICVVCHTPHNADISVTLAPLWNHELTTQTFQTYSSFTFDATGTIGQPDGVSKLCLSCHDGTVALEAFGGVNSGTNFISGNALIGTDLRNDHPVSFTFDAALATADGGLHNPITQASGLGNTIDVDMLRGGKVQCVSCHEPHNKYGNNKFLRKNNTGSALCLTCHDK